MTSATTSRIFSLSPISALSQPAERLKQVLVCLLCKLKNDCFFFQVNAGRGLFKATAACFHSGMVVELTEGAQDVEADLKEPGAQQSQATAKDNPGGTA